jgi:hypothetical protein
MDTHQLVVQGNQHRDQDYYHEALRCYAESFLLDHTNKHAWNNYGNVLREIGEPTRAVPFLEHATAIDPDFVTAHFNLAITHLLAGNYKQGWEKYEWRWRYEHLDGTLPNLSKPRWTGQDLKDKTILVLQEQGFGDIIMMSRFLHDLYLRGCKIKLQVLPGLVRLYKPSFVLDTVSDSLDDMGDYDYWTPIMSLPGVLGVTLENMRHDLQYLDPMKPEFDRWLDILDPKKHMRIGLCWSGRRDSWLNRYKSMPVETMLNLVRQNPNHEYFCLQLDASDDELNSVRSQGVKIPHNHIQDWLNTAGLMCHLDLVISVDTAVAHMAGSLGKPLWVPLNKFAQDWRWLLHRNDSPWYPSARLFRQPSHGNWQEVIQEMSKFLTYFKI